MNRDSHTDVPSSVRSPLPPSRPATRAEALLRAGVPLSLLLDLAGDDPHSRDLYAHEHAPRVA